MKAMEALVASTSHSVKILHKNERSNITNIFRWLEIERGKIINEIVEVKKFEKQDLLPQL